MNRINTLVLALAGVATLGLGAAGVSMAADQTGQPTAAAQGPGGGPGGRWDPAERAARMQARAERRAQHLRDVLQLRQDQEPALQALITSIRPPEGMRGLRRGMGRGGMGPGGMGQREQLTTPQRLDRMQQMMELRQRAFAQRADAIRRFYSQLSPSQQRAFDALPPMGMGHRGMGGRRGGMGGHHRFGGRGGWGGPGGGMGPGGPGGPPGMDGGPDGPDDGPAQR